MPMFQQMNLGRTRKEKKKNELSPDSYLDSIIEPVRQLWKDIFLREFSSAAIAIENDTDTT